MTTAQIAAGQILNIIFIGDSKAKSTCTVLERKDSFAIVLIDGKIERKKVYTSYDGSEYIFPFGKYSLCPTARPE